MPKTYTVSTLENGIRVVAAPMQERSSVAIGVWVGVGARHEEARLGGVSHFLEHLVFKGTGRRTANQIKESIEGVGGSMNAFTSEEYTCFLAKIARKHFDSVFDVLADMVLDASLTEKDIEKERTVIMEEIKMTQDQPSQLADEILSEIVWPEHPLGRPIAGTLDTVGAMKPAEIAGYRNEHYRPGQIYVVAAGAIDQQYLEEITRKTFRGPLQKNAASASLFARSQAKPRVQLLTKPTEQTHLSIALHAFSKDHAEEYALDLLNVILGGNMSSRLFNEVREERGLAYDVGSYVRRYHETGSFGVSAGVDNKKALEALKVILQELEKTIEAPVSADELKRAKDFYLGQLDLGLENSMNQMLWIGENIVTLGRCRTQEEVAAKVESITPAELQRVAQEVFKTSSLNLALVGPLDNDKEFLSHLNFSRH